MSEVQDAPPVTGARTPEHDKLEPFTGTFRTEVKLWMGPGDPMESTGTMVNEWVLDGRYLRQTYTGDPSEGPFDKFEGIGYWGFDPTSGEFQGFWIDNASTTMQVESGSVDAQGKTWTMHSRMLNPQTGQPMDKRTVITLEDDDHHLMESYFSDDSGQEFKSMEIRYTRKP